MPRDAETREQTSFILFTDIYRSSSLWECYPDEFSRVLEKHNGIVEQAVQSRDGEIMKNLGDGYIALFDTSSACISAMVDVKKGVGALSPLPDGTKLLLRVVAHGGQLKRLAVGQGYFGHPLNRASRIAQVCNPGQAILSDTVRTHLSEVPQDTSIVDLGIHYLRDLQEPEKLYQLNHPDFPSHEFSPLATLKNRPNNLAFQPNSFIGRELELHELTQLILGGYHRLITISAPGGYGKSRLATLQTAVPASANSLMKELQSFMHSGQIQSSRGSPQVLSAFVEPAAAFLVIREQDSKSRLQAAELSAYGLPPSSSYRRSGSRGRYWNGPTDCRSTARRITGPVPRPSTAQ